MGFYESLANAIIEQAVKDYRQAVITLKRPNLREGSRISAEKMKRECERFFLGDHIKTLTSVDGKYILKKLEEELLISQS